jgi:hypothetical protein
MALVHSPWDVADMRESEVERLDEIEAAADDLDQLKADVERRIAERLVVAALELAHDVPDAPRRRQEATT